MSGATVQRVCVNLIDLMKDSVSCSRSTSFGYYSSLLFKSSTSTECIEYDLVLDAGERFINLFGLFVGVNSGDIALGFFPDGDFYIRIGNVYDIINYAMFKTNTRILDLEDYRYILEGLKINPELVASSIENDIKSIMSSRRNEYEYQSVILNAISERGERSYPPEVKKFLEGGCKRSQWMVNLIRECLVKYSEADNLAREYFGNFISEDSSYEVVANSSKSLKDVIDAKAPNIESLMIKYLSYGVPPEFLHALASYGFGIKQRKTLYFTLSSALKAKTDLKALYPLCENMSSMAYVEYEKTTQPQIRSYNIMDMLRSSGWDASLLFSIEVLKRYKNSSLYSSISRRFSLEDFMIESKMTENEFILSIDKYRKRFLGLIDRGSMYSRNVLFRQYSFTIFGRRMLIGSGRVFEKASDMILKKF